MNHPRRLCRCLFSHTEPSACFRPGAARNFLAGKSALSVSCFNGISNFRRGSEERKKCAGENGEEVQEAFKNHFVGAKRLNTLLAVVCNA